MPTEDERLAVARKAMGRAYTEDHTFAAERLKQAREVRMRVGPDPKLDGEIAHLTKLLGPDHAENVTRKTANYQGVAATRTGGMAPTKD